jgi:gliding motility-associated lipoprotein GldD
MQKNRKYRYIIIILTASILFSCRNQMVPKPIGHFRIGFPAKSYRLYDTTCPFVFEYPVYGNISYNVGKISEPCWFNIEFPGYRAKIHVSYKQIHGNLETILNDSHEFAYSHSIKADAINELEWSYPEKRVYGILFDIKGNAASSVQFIATDSIHNFLRGALYFTAQPNEDSLAPVIKFFREDIVHMVETLKWK